MMFLALPSKNLFILKREIGQKLLFYNYRLVDLSSLVFSIIEDLVRILE